ncbi:MAG: S24 family peptidase [Candidatus Kapabacteria bacterium]|nr:S24 family peptidase [Candidatus Kapabacteria bacterium]
MGNAKIIQPSFTLPNEINAYYHSLLNLEALNTSGTKIAQQGPILDFEGLVKEIKSGPDSFFVCQANGNSMSCAGIVDSATVIVEKKQEPIMNEIIVCKIDDELFIRRYTEADKHVVLVADNPIYKDITIRMRMDFQILGRVVLVIQKLNN